MEQISQCHNAPAYTAHGCDDDLQHLGKPCTCAKTNAVVTCWYECSKCKQPCDIKTVKLTLCESIKQFFKL